MIVGTEYDLSPRDRTVGTERHNSHKPPVRRKGLRCQRVNMEVRGYRKCGTGGSGESENKNFPQTQKHWSRVSKAD